MNHGGGTAIGDEKGLVTREATVDELDVGQEVTAFWLQLGGAWMALEECQKAGKAPGYDAERWNRHAIAFGKALGQLAKENPGRTRELWVEALHQPLPFGLPPPGMPRVPK